MLPAYSSLSSLFLIWKQYKQILAFPFHLGFTSCEAYLNYTDTVRRPENTQFLIGHVTLRVAVMGYADREPTKEELEQMKALLREAMEHGAAGMSSGL